MFAQELNGGICGAFQNEDVSFLYAEPPCPFDIPCGPFAVSAIRLRQSGIRLTKPSLSQYLCIDSLRRISAGGRRKKSEAKQNNEKRNYGLGGQGRPLLSAWTTVMPAPLGEPSSTRSIVSVFWLCWNRTSPRKTLPKSRTWKRWRP